MAKNPHRETLIWATVCVWSAVGIVGTTRFKLASRAAVTVQLVTHPQAVRVTIDGDKYASGSYLETPLRLTMRPGRRRVKVARDGFVPQQLSVDGASGDLLKPDPINLVRNSAMSFASVVVTADDAPFYVEIDDGLYRGQTPLTAVDLVANQPHQLTVFPRWPAKDGKTRCSFMAPADVKETVPLRLRIRMKNSRLKILGCETSRDSKHR